MTKVVYLHAGLHKTGTSSIQRFLSINNKKLKDHSYCYYIPDPWPIPFTSEPKIDLDVSGLKKIKDLPEDNIIISHENFSWLYEQNKLNGLARALKEVAQNVKVVIYLRRQDSLAVSQKQEGTKWIDNSVAYGHELKALPSELNYYSENYLDFYSRIKSWKEAFGYNNVVVRVFDKQLLINNDVVDDFCSAVNLSDTSDFIKVGNVNESITRKKQLFLHHTRKHFSEQTLEKHLLVKKVLALKIDDKEKLLPSRAEAESFYDKFSEGNKKLNEFIPDRENSNIFSDDFSMYPDISNELFGEAEKEEVYIALIRSLLNEIDAMSKEINSVALAEKYRDMALKVEKNHPYVAHDLMSRAYALKPDGPFILEKLRSYKKDLNKK